MHNSVERGYTSNRLSRIVSNHTSKGLDISTNKLRFASQDESSEEDGDMGDRMGDLANVREIRSVPTRTVPESDTRCFCIRWFDGNERQTAG